MLIGLLFNHGARRKYTLNSCIARLTCKTHHSGSDSTSSSCRRQLHGSKWKRENAVDQQRRKIIPRLVYLHNPWKYLITKFNMWKLKWLWDYGFSENDFVEGSKQAVIVMTDMIRQQSADQIGEFTTPVGFQQITRDMLLSRSDTRLQLVRFEKEHIRRAIPMKVATRKNFGRKYAFIDMLFVGLRNTKDFDSPQELIEINDLLRRMDTELKTPHDVLSVPHRIVFAEIFIRFRRDYTAEWRRKQEELKYPSTDSMLKQNDPHSLEQTKLSSETEDNLLMGRVLSRLNDPGWSVSFYKILTFDVLNFDPQPNRRS